MNPRIRTVSPTDLEAVLAMNEAAVPHVNSLTPQDLRVFLDSAAYFKVATDAADKPVGFLIGLNPDTDYDSPNFGWFCSHYERFAYIDRIAVDSGARKQGIAKALYLDYGEVAMDWADRLTCEVNLRPSNPGSMAFHQSMGFTQVGSQVIHDGAKEVALLSKELRS
jgi:predicted GNAT superfamily acetyltransferase